MKMKKLTLFLSLLISIILSSCNTTNGIYIYFDEITKNTYKDDNILVLLCPINHYTTGLYIYNNTEKIVFVDAGTSFLNTNGQVETIYKARTNFTGQMDFMSSHYTYNIPSLPVTTQSLGTGNFQGDMISEKRILPIAPNAIQCIMAFSVPDILVRKGVFLKFSRNSSYKLADGWRGKNLKRGMYAVYNEENSILNWKVSLRYSFKEDMSDSKDVRTGNYLKAWVIDNKEGLYDYNNANLPYVSRFKNDSINYSLFNKFNTKGK